jgi:hypothetical protein
MRLLPSKNTVPTLRFTQENSPMPALFATRSTFPNRPTAPLCGGNTAFHESTHFNSTPGGLVRLSLWHAAL